MTITIRDAKSSDMAAFAAIYKEIYNTVYAEFIDPRLIESIRREDSEQRMRSDWLAPGAEVFAAEDAETGEIVGFVSGIPSPDVMGAFWLEKLYLIEQVRGQGLGKRMICRMGQRVREQGYASMVIDVFLGNDTAEQIYRHLGARVVRESYYQDVNDFSVRSRLLIFEDLGALEKLQKDIFAEEL